MSATPLSIVALIAPLACANPRAAGEAPPGERLSDACAGVPEAEWEASPLEAPYTIERISPVYRYLWTGRGARRTPVLGSGTVTSVLVTLNTPARTTREALEARLQCHIAWMRSSGNDSPALRTCPLAVPGVSAEVRMGYGQRYIIAIGSKDERAAKEVWRRADAMVGTGKDASDVGEPME